MEESDDTKIKQDITKRDHVHIARNLLYSRLNHTVRGHVDDPR